MLALSLLDILVKNCGYPMHLQISTKEFLNELVRRFPERPPALAPPPMAKILSLIHEWKSTICVTSKHKEDLVHVRDMHRLLSYKGYRFPDYDRRSAAVLTPSDTLQSAEELEEADREAQAAKLQELIRRGTPKDLAAAQELMKIMAGAEPDKKPDYESQTRKELQQIQQRVLLLNEMLSNAKPNERFVEGDAYDIAQRIRQVQPRLQRIIGDASENAPDEMGSSAATLAELILADKLLLLNDLMNQVLKRYDAYLAGDRTAVVEIDPALSPSHRTAAASRAAAAPNLIDFDDFSVPAPAAPAASSSSAPAPLLSDLDELASLSIGPSQPAQPSLPFGNGGSFPIQPSTPGAIQLGSSRPSSTGPVHAMQPTSRPASTAPAVPPPMSRPPPATAAPADPFADLANW